MARQPPVHDGGEGGYAAFISYSHAVDGKLAPALQRGLQRFAKRWWELRALNVFRDETSLSTNPHLWQSIETALAKSRYFLLLASPRAAQSEWVAREVEWWKANRPLDRLLIVVTQGRLKWDHATGDFLWDAETPLPPNLRGVFTDSPRHLDLRWAQDAATDLSLQHNRFREAIADLAATLHGRPKEELIGEEVTQHRRVRRLTRGALAALTVLTLSAVAAAYWAVRQERVATEQAAIAIEQRNAAEAARNEALQRLADFVHERATTTVKPLLSLALTYRLAADPGLRAGLSEATRAQVEAELSSRLGAAMVARVAPNGFGLDRSVWPQAFGMANGEPAVLATVTGPGSALPPIELLGLVGGELLGSMAPGSFGRPEEGIMRATMPIPDHALVSGYEGSRELWRFDRPGQPLRRVVSLPELPRNPDESLFIDDSRLSPDGRTLLVIASGNDGGLDITHAIDLESGASVPIDSSGTLELRRSEFGGTTVLTAAKRDFLVTELDRRFALMVHSEHEDVGALLDLSTGQWIPFYSPLAGAMANIGLATGDAVWVSNGKEVAVFAPATGEVIARLELGDQVDYVTDVVDADMVALLDCGKSAELLDLPHLDHATRFDLRSGCSADRWPTAPLRASTGDFLFHIQPERLSAGLELIDPSGTVLGGAEVPMTVSLDFATDATASWALVDLTSYTPVLVPLTASLDELLALVRHELGPLVDTDLGQLLDEAKRYQ